MDLWEHTPRAIASRPAGELFHIPQLLDHPFLLPDQGGDGMADLVQRPLHLGHVMVEQLQQHAGQLAAHHALSVTGRQIDDRFLQGLGRAFAQHRVCEVVWCSVKKILSQRSSLRVTIRFPRKFDNYCHWKCCPTHQKCSSTKQLRKLLMISDRKPIRLGQYLHGTATSVTGAQRRTASALSAGTPSRTVRRGLGADSQSVEVRDPLEVMLLTGDRDEYVDRSFWHDAEADGVTFQESRVDGRWDEDGGEWWK